MNKQGAQIYVTALADAQKRWLASARMLPRHKAKPSRELPAVVEAVRIGDGSHQGARPQWPDARNLLEPEAQFAAAMPSFDVVLEFVNQLVQFLQVLGQASNQLAERPWQLIARVFEQTGDLLGDVADALRNDQSELAEQAANLVGLRRAGK